MRIGLQAIPRALAASLLTLLLLAPLPASKKNAPPTKMVDSGVFGIFVGGRRVASEKFQIEQTPELSVAKSELLLEENGNRPSQSAELTLGPGGDLVRYEWKELGAEKATAVVEPQNEFLVERFNGGEPNDKTIEQPYILPTSTMIVDDYFFSHRELLAWRYLASCEPEAGKEGCKLAKSEFGVLVPRQRAPIMVTMEYAGRETIQFKGQPVEMDRVNLTADGTDWSMWLNINDHKLQRILIAAAATEVIRE